ncbi:hypothetical protein I4U23_023088 [Adineta vaga]|nr:hypothetical protein I4U23_023088 [Adineta vaga]
MILQNKNFISILGVLLHLLYLQLRKKYPPMEKTLVVLYKAAKDNEAILSILKGVVPSDLDFYNFGELILDFNPDCFNNYSWLQNNRAEVAKQPKIAEYLKNRPKTM